MLLTFLLFAFLLDTHTDYSIHDPDICFQTCQKVLDNLVPRKKK